MYGSVEVRARHESSLCWRATGFPKRFFYFLKHIGWSTSQKKNERTSLEERVIGKLMTARIFAGSARLLAASTRWPSTAISRRKKQHFEELSWRSAMWKTCNMADKFCRWLMNVRGKTMILSRQQKGMWTTWNPSVESPSHAQNVAGALHNPKGMT